MLPGNGLRHLVIEVHRVTSKLLVNELRHIEKCWLNADRSAHVEKKTLGKMTAILLKWDATRQLPAERTHTLAQWTNRQTEDDTTSHRCLCKSPPPDIRAGRRTTTHRGSARTGFPFSFFFFFLDSAAMRAILIISLKLYGRKICPPTTLMEWIYYVAKQQCLGLKSKMVSLKRKQKFRWLFLFPI